MYDRYRIYGPYGKRRRIVVLVSAEHRTTMSYARYLMSLHIGRELTEGEEVDHLDDDCMNDAIENLQVLTPEQNREKRNRLLRARSWVDVTCPECGNGFARRRSYLRRTPVPSCSRSCSAKFHNRKRSSAGPI